MRIKIRAYWILDYLICPIFCLDIVGTYSGCVSCPPVGVIVYDIVDENGIFEKHILYRG